MKILSFALILLLGSLSQAKPIFPKIEALKQLADLSYERSRLGTQIEGKTPNDQSCTLHVWDMLNTDIGGYVYILTLSLEDQKHSIEISEKWQVSQDGSTTMVLTPKTETRPLLSQWWDLHTDSGKVTSIEVNGPGVHDDIICILKN
jgi:hypothetical protein